jgi:CBS domain containing-hemolysin-like protein
LDSEPSYTLLATLDTNLLLGIIAIVFLLICSAMVSAAEVALFSLTQNDLTQLAEEDTSKANLISKLIQRPKKLLATILVANNFSHIGVVIIFSFVGNSLFEVIASPIVKFLVEVLLVTFLILLFGEVLPKIYASRNNVKFSKFVANPMYILDKLLSPISLPMRSLSVLLNDKLGKQKSSISVDQLSQA